MAAPSFSSFPDIDSEQTGSRNDRLENDGKKRRKKDGHRKVRHKSKETSPCGEKGGEDVAANDPLRLFYSDRRGDYLNIQFGGLRVNDVPKYHLVDNTRNVLGLSGLMKIHRRAAQGVEVGRSAYHRMSSLTDSGTRSLLKKNPERRLKPLKPLNLGNEEDGIIRLMSSKGSRKPEDSYRSITGDLNASDSYASSSENGVLNSDEDDQPSLTAHQEILKTLEDDITTNPASADKWLALLHQTLLTTPTTSKNATKVRSEITVSVLSRALAADPHNTKNKVLRILYLKACEEVWQEDKLSSEWDQAFKDGDIEIVMEWLEWKIRKGLGLDGLVTSAVKALGRLERGADESAKIRIFWRIAFAIRSAGYTERAMAMFQTQAELMFNLPPELSTVPFHNRLDELEEFWDSEVPRLGEEGGKGWKLWYSSKSSQSLLPTPPLPSSRPDLDPYRDWARREALFDSRTLLPSRSDSETSDPHSTVLFSDIRPFLLDIRGRHAMEGFRLAWLSFLGLYLPGFRLSASPELDWDDRWNLEFLTRAPILNSIFPSEDFHMPLMTDAVAGVIIGRERQYSSPFGPVRCWGHGVCDALDLASAEPGKHQRRGVWSQNDIAEVDGTIVRHIFSSLRMGKDDVEWDSLALAFELAVNPMGASKKSKALLSTNQDSFALWCLHAQLERLRGRLDEARKVYQTILIASQPDNSQPYIGRMWWNWVEMEWLAGGEGESLNVILKSMGLEGSNSGVTILRGKRILDDLVVSTDPMNWKHSEAWIRMRALLELLTGSPSSAIAIVDKYLTGAKCGSFHESLTTFALLMLYYHGVTLRNSMPPSILRDRAHAAFGVYPNNSIILGLLLESEKGQGVWGRLRKTLGGSDRKAKDVASRIEEVWIPAWEKGRWVSELERTRNGLAAAVEHERTRSSSIVWRIYIEFEIRAGELQRAKKLLFRAIRECPMVKGIHLLAFGPLRSCFTTDELNALADTMAERGLRLHQGLDEVLGEMDVVEDKTLDDIYDMSGDDEIEHNAKELKRLKPY